MIKRAATVGLSALLVSSCATVAPREEYVAYRAYRYERSEERRTALGSAYLAKYPRGRFSAELRVTVGGREEQFWEERRSSEAGVQAYLAAYPSGSHAAEARVRLAAYAAERDRLDAVRRSAEEAERVQRLAEVRARAERERYAPRDMVRTWLSLLGGLQNWGGTLREIAPANPEFNRQFGETGTPPVRRPGGFRKTSQWDFFVPNPGGSALPRRLSSSLDLLLRDQHLAQAALVMHRRGLTTWYELERRERADLNDTQSRQQTVQWAMAQLRGLLAATFPDAQETPTELVGPEPEMEGEIADEPAAAATGSPNAAASAIPPQPLGVQWSYIVGCGPRGGARIAAPEGTRPEGWTDPVTAPTQPHACLRIDAYSAPAIEGVSTDEGLRISFIPPSALAAPGARPARSRRPAAGGRARPPAAPSPPPAPAARR